MKVANSGVWKPTDQEQEKKIAGSCDLTHVSLKAGGAAAVVSLYDGNSSDDKKPTNLRWVLDASTGTPDNEDFSEPLNFKKGIYAVLEQGNNFNAILCFAADKTVFN